MVLNDQYFNLQFESDPDTKVYNEITTMHMDNSYYCFENQLKQMTGNCLQLYIRVSKTSQPIKLSLNLY